MVIKVLIVLGLHLIGPIFLLQAITLLALAKNRYGRNFYFQSLTLDLMQSERLKQLKTQCPYLFLLEDIG